MNSKYESLKKQNAKLQNELESAVKMTVVSTDKWEALLKLQATQSEQLDEIYKFAKSSAGQTTLLTLSEKVDRQQEDLKTAVKDASTDAITDIKTAADGFCTQAGKKTDDFASKITELENTTADIRKRLIPLLIGIPTGVQVLFLTVYILWEIFSK